MSGDEVKVGDVVKLNSGGPPMAVGRTWDGDRGRMASCSWFSDLGNANHHDFPAACLTVQPAED